MKRRETSKRAPGPEPKRDRYDTNTGYFEFLEEGDTREVVQFCGEDRFRCWVKPSKGDFEALRVAVVEGRSIPVPPPVRQRELAAYVGACETVILMLGDLLRRTSRGTPIEPGDFECDAIDRAMDESNVEWLRETLYEGLLIPIVRRKESEAAL